ncbi:MAG: replication initiator protein [Microvirus sp.]|nr:MAG: replication initiator protein [Microvirus sp.]
MSKCIDPVLCYDDGKTRKFRHFSLSTPGFKLIHNKVYNCGKCIFCRKRRSTELATRCVLHASLYRDNCFLTLTYDETKTGYHNRFDYTDIQKFKKRLRQHCHREYDGKKIQIFNVHEYGKNGKKHWHLVVFNHDFSTDPEPELERVLHSYKGDHALYRSPRLETLWPFGYNTVGSVTEASAMYQAQYTQKDFQNGNVSNSRKSHSKHSGIGREYFLNNYKQILTLGFIPFNGRKIPIPRYFLKLAHKHYCHFYEPHYFFDNSRRKRVHTPFADTEPNREIAELFIFHSERRESHLEELHLEWSDWVWDNYNSKLPPDFLISGENYLHDLKNRNTNDNF